MRTSDFSFAPPLGQAGAAFVGGNRFSTLRSMLAMVLFRWRPVVRALRASPGYQAHFSYYRFPLTIGLLVFFADADSLMLFARSRAHRDVMRWIASPPKATGGFIRIYEARPDGYSNGVWRAEGNHELGLIPRFTAVGGEGEGPTVQLV